MLCNAVMSEQGHAGNRTSPSWTLIPVIPHCLYCRHLVLNKDKAVMEMERTLGTKKKDKIRYQYDEHYFLCDPLEFIQEFYPDDPKWQLLEHPLILEEFESLPFVR